MNTLILVFSLSIVSIGFLPGKWKPVGFASARMIPGHPQKPIADGDIHLDLLLVCLVKDPHLDFHHNGKAGIELFRDRIKYMEGHIMPMVATGGIYPDPKIIYNHLSGELRARKQNFLWSAFIGNDDQKIIMTATRNARSIAIGLYTSDAAERSGLEFDPMAAFWPVVR